MAENNPQSVEFRPAMLEQLACPACQGELALAGGAIRCRGCGRSYPLIDGIPVLIAERALAE